MLHKSASMPKIGHSATSLAIGVIGYRASLILGTPRTELREPWDQMLIACPNWPGFRQERADHSLKDALEAENQEMIQQLDHMSEVCERHQCDSGKEKE